MENTNINVSIDPFITNTRVRVCFASQCVNNVDKQCRYKEIKIRDDGTCGSYWIKKSRVKND